jgi:hypothetical protein
MEMAKISVLWERCNFSTREIFVNNASAVSIGIEINLA